MDAPGPLVPLLLAHLPGPPPDDLAVLEELLQGLLRTGRDAWPDVALGAEDFLRHVARHIGDSAGLGQLAALRAADLYLACACARGVPAALRRFEEAVLPQVTPAVARVASSPAAIDETMQTLRARLLVAATPDEPLIGQYGGRGALVAWVRVIAARIALNLRRGKLDQLAVSDGALDRHPGGAPGDAEIDLIKARYRQEFADAFKGALAVLTTQQRNVLRVHYLDGLTLEQAAALFRKDRSTVIRWIAAAREAILEEAQRLLRERLGVDSAEFASLAGVLRSQLDLSLGGLLAEGAPPPR